jgi:hypothetical protein
VWRAGNHFQLLKANTRRPHVIFAGSIVAAAHTLCGRAKLDERVRLVERQRATLAQFPDKCLAT